MPCQEQPHSPRPLASESNVPPNRPLLIGSDNATCREVDGVRPAAGEADQRFIDVSAPDFFGAEPLNLEGFVRTKKNKRGHEAFTLSQFVPAAERGTLRLRGAYLKLQPGPDDRPHLDKHLSGNCFSSHRVVEGNESIKAELDESPLARCTSPFPVPNR